MPANLTRWHLILGVLMMLGLFGLYLLVFVPKADEHWERFKIAHNCKHLAETAGDDSQTGWLCDDGKVYHRRRQK